MRWMIAKILVYGRVTTATSYMDFLSDRQQNFVHDHLHSHREELPIPSNIDAPFDCQPHTVVIPVIRWYGSTSAILSMANASSQRGNVYELETLMAFSGIEGQKPFETNTHINWHCFVYSMTLTLPGWSHHIPRRGGVGKYISRLRASSGKGGTG